MSDRPFLPCREVLDFLYLYVSGELPEEEKAAFDRHLGACLSCRNYLESYKQAVALGRAAFDELEPPGLPEELVAAIKAARAGNR